MFNFYGRLVEERIRAAQERGEFESLPGRGEPLELDDDRGVPEDLRLAYKILKNADCLPPELLVQREIRQTVDLLAGLSDESEKLKAMKKLNYLVLKLNQSRPRAVTLEEADYHARVVERLEGSPNKK